jgi:serine/threonine protein kinase
MSNPEQFAEHVFGLALELPAEERCAFLDKACHDNPELRRQVDALLLEDQKAAGFLSSPVFTPGVHDCQSAADSWSVRLADGSKLGRYCIIEPIGAGGMGVVYRARDERLDRDVAIKILAPGVLMGEGLRRFRKEALVLAKLSHPHIAAVFDVGQENGVDYIVMECVAGETLSKKLESGPLSVKNATSIVLQIAEALEEAHEHGVIHRDLKPANVMLTPKGQVKVLDFGIAKLLSPFGMEVTETIGETQGILGTPQYMSPEQVNQKPVDARTDLWSLGVLYYQLIAGRVPFRGDSNIATLRAIVEQNPRTLRQVRPDTPPLAERIVTRALQKVPNSRYQSASEVVKDASNLLSELTASHSLAIHQKKSRRGFALISVAVLLLLVAAGIYFYRSSRRQWAREQGMPQINSLLDQKKPLAAFQLLDTANEYLPHDPQLQQIADGNSGTVSVTSSPAGATVEIQDYATAAGPWRSLGVTPLNNIRIPKGYFRWKVSKAGSGEMLVAPTTDRNMNFALDAARQAPEDMVTAPGGRWSDDVSFVGWLGPYNLPAFYIDKYEVTNREYQNFVDNGGYDKKQYWPETFSENGHNLSWNDAMARFRDTSGRPGPSTWAAGHYPEGKADYPVSGVSWYEASAYAVFAGKQLPVLAQWLDMAPPDVTPYIAAASNIASGNLKSKSALTAVGTYPGIGPFGTYDAAGNVSEWVANSVDDGLKFSMGGSWKSPAYQYYSPNALSPFDRSDEDGFRCVRNLGAMPVEASAPLKLLSRDFSRYKPVSDTVFSAYKLLYAYPNAPQHATENGVVEETADWREEKVTFDTGYLGERMSAYLFLPKNVRPPYQTVLFFPSARIYFIPDNKGGRQLGDTNFFDYVIESGRAVMYPIYENTYERRLNFSLPSGEQAIQLTTDWYKDAARSLDYLATRPDIDSSKLAYLGVSMGSADGAIITTLLQDRLKTAVLLDGGYFLEPPPPGADQADFVTRMKKPVLLVNGRYDFTFPLETSQNPFFNMLGTAPADKRHVVLDSSHDVTEQRSQLTKAVLDWLDHYLGRVN